MKSFKKILAAVLFIAAGVLAVVAVQRYLKEKNAGKEYEDIREAVVKDDADISTENADDESSDDSDEQAEVTPTEKPNVVKPGTTIPSFPTPTPVPEKEVPIDFTELTKRCPDAYAWIRIPDTNVDYPIVQHPTDNSYYLNHSAEGGYKFAGAIYTENYNTKDFTDPNTVIYGHNMKNGSMFETLHKFSDKAFFDEHKEFEIYLPDKVLTYRVFAAYVYDDRHLLKAFDFSDPEVFRMYLRDIQFMRGMGYNVDTEPELTADDRIVTLSTCNSNSSQRYLVQGVLLSN